MDAKKLEIQLDDFIDLDKRQMIRPIIENLIRTKQKVRVWGKISELDNVEFGKITDIKEWGQGIITIQANYGSDFSDFDEEMSIFFHSHHRTTLFKTTILSVKKDSISVLLPEIVKIQDGRRELRNYPCASKQWTAKFLIDKDDISFLLNGRVSDTSENGMGIIINKKNGDKISLDDTIRLHEYEMNGELKIKEGIIRNLNEFKNIHTGENELG